MKIAVTGSRGQLAHSLGELAQERGVSCFTLARPLFDLTSEGSVSRAVEGLDCDVLINAAAYTAVDRAEQEPETAFAINAKGAELLAHACQHRGIPIIHISTDYVFDGTKADAYVESDVTKPINVYGHSKSVGEERVARNCARHIILRTSWVHSPFGSNFVRTMLRLGRERSEISVVADQHGSPTYAPHLAEVIMAIADRITCDPVSIPWGLYHYADEGRTSWFDIATATFAASRSLGGPVAEVRPVPTSAYKTAARRPMNSWLATSKLRGTFVIAPPWWGQGVSKGVGRLLAASDIGS